MAKIMEQVHEILKLKEELFYYRTEFFRVAEENNTLNEQKKL